MTHTDFLSRSTFILGIGSVAFGVWGLVHPDSLTRLMGDDPQYGRWLGVRDTAVGASLLARPGPVPIGLRLSADLHDAYRLRRRSPRVALAAAGFAAWGAVSLALSLAARRQRERV